MRSAAAVIMLALVASCTPDQPASDGRGAWLRTLPGARFSSAPLAAGDDVVLAVTSLGTAPILDAAGHTAGLVAGNERRATCSVLRFGDAGAVRWQLALTARAGQTLCTSVDAADDDVAGGVLVHGEAFDLDDDGALVEAGGLIARVDEGFDVLVDGDGLVRSIAPTPPPLHAFPTGGAALDVLGRTLRAPSSAGYLEENGAVIVDDVAFVSLLVPQGTALDPLVDGAQPAPHVGAPDESVVVVARIDP